MVESSHSRLMASKYIARSPARYSPISRSSFLNARPSHIQSNNHTVPLPSVTSVLSMAQVKTSSTHVRRHFELVEELSFITLRLRLRPKFTPSSSSANSLFWYLVCRLKSVH